MTGPHKAGDILSLRYKVDSFIGEGGMQFVYKAYDSTTKRLVALKTPKNSSGDKRFKKSAILASRVNHPNVAKTLDYFEFSGRKYLIEEYVDGQDLDKSIYAVLNYVDPFLVAKIFHYLAKGLAASHHADVVHRDLKPTNIMISGGLSLSQVKITDFGIAKMAEEEFTAAAVGGEDTLSASHTVLGALAYMAPETIETPHQVHTPADVWSLGAMAFELLCGVKPFGVGLKAVGGITSGKPPLFPGFVNQNPQFKVLADQLIDLIGRCLQRKPEDRPTADDLVNLLGEFCYPVAARRTGHIKFQNFGWGFIATGFGEDDVH